MANTHADAADSNRKSLCQVAATCALVVVLIALLDIIIMFVPGASAAEPGTLTVADWFALFQAHPLLGLRNLGLLNVATNALTVPLFVALYTVHRNMNKTYAALAVIALIMGATIYIANNTALPMLSLSGQFGSATTESQKSLLVAAGQALLAHEDLTAGSFMGFFFAEVAQIVMGLVMLRSTIFGRRIALSGLLGSGSLLIFNICAAFVPSVYRPAMILATFGGMVMVAYYVMIARTLLQLGRTEREAPLQRTAM
jgi:hypothetical protein